MPIPHDVPGQLLRPEEVAEFQRLMKECGEDLDASTAYLRATELVQLMRLLASKEGDVPQEGSAEKAEPEHEESEDPLVSSTAPTGVTIVYR